MTHVQFDQDALFKRVVFDNYIVVGFAPVKKHYAKEKQGYFFSHGCSDYVIPFPVWERTFPGDRLLRGAALSAGRTPYIFLFRMESTIWRV
jgi:hypothetical protein